MTEWAPMLDGVCELGRESCQRRIAAALIAARLEALEEAKATVANRAAEIRGDNLNARMVRDAIASAGDCIQALIDAQPKASERGEG